MRLTPALTLLLAAAAAGCGANPTALCTPPKCAPQSLAWALEVVPAGASMLPSQEFGSFDPSGRHVEVQLDPPVLLTGTVRIGASPAVELKASIDAYRASRIYGRSPVFYPPVMVGADGSYALVVAPTVEGESYTVRVTPDATALSPPQLFEHVTAAPDVQPFDPVLDPPATLIEVRGQIQDGSDHPLAGMQIQAVDDNQDRVSTVSIADANGAYSIRLARALGNRVKLQVTPPRPSDSLLWLELDLSLAGVQPGQVVVANMHAPPLPPTREVTYSVVGADLSGAPRPVVGAHCVFLYTLRTSSQLLISFKGEGVTDIDGKMTVDLLPGSSSNRVYQVTVVPPPSSLYQKTTVTVAVGSSSGVSAPIVLELRPQVRGRVLDSRHSPLRNVTVTPGDATLVAQPDSITTTPAPGEAVTDASGVFVLRLDTGVYDLGLIPPPRAQLPLTWVAGARIDSDTNLGDLVVPMGTLVVAQVRTSSGMPLGGADVRLYRVPDKAACAENNPSCRAPARLGAEGTSGNDGAVPLTLPSQNAVPGHY